MATICSLAVFIYGAPVFVVTMPIMFLIGVMGTLVVHKELAMPNNGDTAIHQQYHAIPEKPMFLVKNINILPDVIQCPETVTSEDFVRMDTKMWNDMKIIIKIDSSDAIVSASIIVIESLIKITVIPEETMTLNEYVHEVLLTEAEVQKVEIAITESNNGNYEINRMGIQITSSRENGYVQYLKRLVIIFPNQDAEGTSDLLTDSLCDFIERSKRDVLAL